MDMQVHFLCDEWPYAIRCVPAEAVVEESELSQSKKSGNKCEAELEKKSSCDRDLRR
ncbi:hypothetical protein D9M68_956460 [compost metagenome]